MNFTIALLFTGWLIVRYTLFTYYFIYQCALLRIKCVVFTHTVDARLTSESPSSATLINNSVGFSCCTDASLQIHVQWHFKYPHDGQLHVIYNGKSVHRHLRPYIDVRFNASSGCSHLTISQVTASNAGTYSCLESNTAHSKLHFQLVVLGRYDKFSYFFLFLNIVYYVFLLFPAMFCGK